MKSTLIITLLIPILFSCKKEVYQPIQIPCSLTMDLDSSRSLIKGTWIWLEEKYANLLDGRYDYLTPKTEGYTRSLSFINDTARFYKNNRPDSVYLYKIVRLTELTGTNYPEDYDPVVVFYHLHNGIRYDFVPLKICQNYLVLKYEMRTHRRGDEIWKKF